MVVSANTLYQNISIIRRGLRTVGENEDFADNHGSRVEAFRCELWCEPHDHPQRLRSDNRKRVRRRHHVCRGVGFGFYYVPVLWMTGTFCCR